MGTAARKLACFYSETQKINLRGRQGRVGNRSLQLLPFLECRTMIQICQEDLDHVPKGLYLPIITSFFPFWSSGHWQKHALKRTTWSRMSVHRSFEHQHRARTGPVIGLFNSQSTLRCPNLDWKNSISFLDRK